MTPALEHSIQTRDLNLWYGDFQALHNVSLNVRHGQITSLIGPSGCGKTTLLRCFNRINERYGYVRTEGEIKVLDKNIYDADVSLIELRKAVGMVFQRPNPLPLSVYENIVLGLRLHHERSALRKADLAS
jgi:phosphate transport system ATP-binding protein